MSSILNQLSPLPMSFISTDQKHGSVTHLFILQSGVEPTDTFQMVIDNKWKQGKISETVYKYVQVCYLLPTDYKLIF